MKKIPDNDDCQLFELRRRALREDGVLLQSRNSVFGESVYLCIRGRRHSVRNADRVRDLGFKWPEDVLQVPESVLKTYLPGGIAPGLWSPNMNCTAINSSIDMREYIASKLHGFGLEVGAGASPFPVPLECKVLYGDMLHIEDLRKGLYEGQQPYDLVFPDIITDFNDFRGIADDSLDFIIGCHVVEHTRNPIGSIVAAHRKLKDGGKLLLVVPDKNRTFDHARPITPLEHLFEDYREPDRDRDYAHYEEFYRLAFRVPDERLVQTVDSAFSQNYDIHYHVWDYDSFSKMIKSIQKNITRWSDIWSHPTLSNIEHDIEFYFLLTK